MLRYAKAITAGIGGFVALWAKTHGIDLDEEVVSGLALAFFVWLVPNAGTTVVERRRP